MRILLTQQMFIAVEANEPSYVSMLRCEVCCNSHCIVGTQPNKTILERNIYFANTENNYTTIPVSHISYVFILHSCISRLPGFSK